MAAAVERETSLPVELVEGSGGVFTVSVDGEAVFSKRKTGRFPGEREIVELVRSHGRPAGGS